MERELSVTQTLRGIRVRSYEDAYLDGIVETDGNLEFRFKNGLLKASRCTVIEREEENGCNDRVLFAETYKRVGGFELHFLIENERETGHTKLWYLTLHCEALLEQMGFAGVKQTGVSV